MSSRFNEVDAMLKNVSVYEIFCFTHVRNIIQWQEIFYGCNTTTIVAEKFPLLLLLKIVCCEIVILASIYYMWTVTVVAIYERLRVALLAEAALWHICTTG